MDEINLEPFEQRIFSQNGEDGVTMKLIELLYGNDVKGGYYVEFGVENGVECNTRILREKYDWKGLQMDGSHENKEINLQKEFITKDNVLELFAKHDVPENINLLSVDIDYNDFYCLKKILSKHTCDIIICEYNATHLPNEDKIVIYNERQIWDKSNYFGASLLSLKKLGQYFNYTLVYCDTKGVNCFLVNDEIIKTMKLKFKNVGYIFQLYRTPKYSSGPNGGHPQDPYNRRYITFEEAINL